MVVTGTELNRRVSAARRALKGQRGGVNETQALRELAEATSLRDFYRTSVYSRFHLNRYEQTTLAVAIAYAKGLKRSRAKLYEEIRRAQSVKVTLEETP